MIGQVVEDEQRQEQRALEGRLQILKEKRIALLLWDSKDKAAAKEEIGAVNRQIADLELEIEMLLAVLADLPRRKALERAVEIEASIVEIEASFAEVGELSQEIDQAAREFGAIVARYIKCLNRLRSLNPLTLNFVSTVDWGVKDSLAVGLRENGISRDLIRLGRYRGADEMHEKTEAMGRGVSSLIRRMRASVLELRGGKDETVCAFCFSPLALTPDPSGFPNFYQGGVRQPLACSACGREK